MFGEKEPTKRELRQQKREIKRAGSQRRRRMLKQALRENPEEAPLAEFDFGRFSSAPFNGLDHDATRRRSRPEHEHPAPDSARRHQGDATDSGGDDRR